MDYKLPNTKEGSLLLQAEQTTWPSERARGFGHAFIGVISSVVGGAVMVARRNGGDSVVAGINGRDSKR